MKLWQKISLICSAVLISVVAICCTLLLLHAKSSILSFAYTQAEDKQRNLASSFSEMASYYADDSSNPTTENAFVLYCFSRFADTTSVLMNDRTELYSQVSIHPKDYLVPVERGEQARFAGQIGERNVLIVGSSVTIRQDSYFVYVVQDITSVYNDIARMVWRFVLIGLGGIALGIGIIILLVRRSMWPLNDLGVAAKRIASGNYEERAIIYEKNEVGELADEFNVMAAAVKSHVAELIETAQRQRLFIGGVSHEFKTPLTAILLHTDLLQNAYLTEEETKKSFEHIERQCKWLEQLTQKLLKLICLREQIETKQETAELLLNRVRESTIQTMEQRGVTLAVECAAESFCIDIDLMQSALINLVDNASKASQPGQSVILRAYGNILEVEDHGCGISGEEITHITDPFYMVDKSRSKLKGGSGLGLALVKEIVAAHRASLLIESVPKNGTVIRIILPVTKQ